MLRALVIIALCGGTAVADPDTGVTVADKSPAVATALAAGTTAVGLASIYLAFRDTKAEMTTTEGVLAYGGVLLVLVGPATGHFYVGEKSKTRSYTFVGRLLGGTFIIKHAINPDAANSWDLPLGATLLMVSTLYDVFDAGRAARRHNTRFDIKIAPGVYPTLTGSAPAVTATGRF